MLFVSFTENVASFYCMKSKQRVVICLYVGSMLKVHGCNSDMTKMESELSL